MEDKKFTKEWDIDDYEILTDAGWVDIEKIYETIPYNIWKIKTTNHELECADTHILFRPDYEEVFVKDLKIGDKIITEDGDEEIISIEETNEQVPMYDVALPLDSNHRFYSNGILSHNTTTCCLYALWMAMFNKDQQILLTSYNYDQTVLKNMATIKTAYEYCPKWLKPGVSKYNESSVRFDNGSEIIAKTTTEDCVRGTSPNLIYADELSFTLKGSNNGQRAFYTSISPALSASKGKLMITSTPASEYDIFGSIWKMANRFDEGNPLPKVYVLRDKKGAITDLHCFNTKEEAEEYNKQHTELNSEVFERNGVGYNGFISYLATWKANPDRSPDFERLERLNMGDEMFEREYNCLSGEEVVSIRLPSGEIRNVTLKNLYQYYNINLN